MNTNFFPQWLRLTAVLTAITVLLAALAPVSPAYADSCLVTTDVDSGAGSLREKIADPVCDTITFDGDYTIVLASQLTIDRNVTIDGAGHSVTVSGNHAVRAFEILPDVTFNLSNLSIADSGAGIGYSGGGIYSRGTLYVTNGVFSGNRAQDGAGIYIDLGTASVTDSTFTNNFANWEGGGIYVNSALATVTGSNFNSNRAECGPAIHNGGTLSATNTSITGNFARYCGGGIYNTGALNLTNSTLSENIVDFGTGGAIYNIAGVVTSTNTTITNNFGSFGGGAIINSAGTVTFTNSTLSGNRAGDGAGILNGDGGTATLINTLMANSYNCLNNVDSTLTGSNNLADDDSCGPGFVNSASILLGPLANNGGPTQTMALLPGSAAIDMGDDAVCPETDQRGVARPQGAHCDIGAYEAEPTTADTTPPSITLTTPAEEAVYRLGQTVNADYACQDETGGLGLASCVGTVPNGSPIDTNSVGAKTFIINAADNAGNTNSVTHTYQVVYNFTGFFQPVDNWPTENTMKAGASVPIKFILGGNMGLAILASGSPTSRQVTCPSSSAITADAIEETTTSNSGLTYDAASGQYTYVWKTNKTWATTCRVFTILFADGSSQQALFKFNK